MKYISKYILLIFIIMMLLATAASAFFLLGPARPAEDIKWGVTFSHSYAEDLDLNWKQAYIALLDDLGVRHFRIPIYWDELEPTDDEFDFEKWDWQLKALENRGGNAILSIGQKLPRWPECRVPEWAEKMPREQKEANLFEMLRKVVSRYKNSPAVKVWQIENEPLIPFGECPKIPAPVDLLEKEIELVRKLDPQRPVMLTDAGTGSFWVFSAQRADIVGISVYRFIRQPLNDAFRFFINPTFYGRKKVLASALFPDTKFIVTEMQAEPWPVSGDLNKDYKIMDPAVFAEHLDYAKRSGFDTIYLWGAEWWVWLKEQGEKEIWRQLKALDWQI